MPDRLFLAVVPVLPTDELTRKSGGVVGGVCLAVVAWFAVVTGLGWYAGETSTYLGTVPMLVLLLAIAVVVPTALLAYSS